MRAAVNKSFGVKGFLTPRGVQRSYFFANKRKWQRTVAAASRRSTLKMHTFITIYLFRNDKRDISLCGCALFFYVILELVHNIQQVLIAVYFMVNDIGRREITEQFFGTSNFCLLNRLQI